jgi:hypothetical protein
VDLLENSYRYVTVPYDFYTHKKLLKKEKQPLLCYLGERIELPAVLFVSIDASCVTLWLIVGSSFHNTAFILSINAHVK